MSELVTILKANGTSKAARQAACAALGVAAADGDRKTALTALRLGLEVRDAAVRASCAQALATAAKLGARAGRGAFWRLVELVKHRDERIRAGATLAAARIDPWLFTKKLYLLRREGSKMVKAALAEALAGVPGSKAYKRTVQLTKDEDLMVRRKAVAALLERPERQARKVVAGMIEDSDLETRLLAIQALDGADALEPYLFSDVPALRGAALAGLVTARGQGGTIGVLFGRIAKAPKASETRVRAAVSWLAP